MRKYSVILLEILVAFSLFAILLTALFVSIRFASATVNKKQYLQERRLEQQLERCFQNTSAEIFFTSVEDQDKVVGKSLVFSFDRGAHQKPLLSNTVLGRLYVERSTSCLMLGIWPLPDKREEKLFEAIELLEDVQGVDFEFYFPDKGVNPDSVGHLKPHAGVQNEWSKNYALLPPFLKLFVTRSNGEIAIFAFDIPNASCPIKYF